MIVIKDPHSKWSHRWLNKKAVARSSKIEGTGVFSNNKITFREPVGVLGGVIVHKNEIKEYWEIMGHVGIQIDDDFFIVPTTREELEMYGVFNHSCEPNCGFSNSITLVALRDIEVGEELVFDYAFCEIYQKGFDCKCGTNNCRKRITANDWKLAKIQKKHIKYFSPYLRDKISEATN
jgi:hypothetical protein